MVEIIPYIYRSADLLEWNANTYEFFLNPNHLRLLLTGRRMLKPHLTFTNYRLNPAVDSTYYLEMSFPRPKPVRAFD